MKLGVDIVGGPGFSGGKRVHVDDVEGLDPGVGHVSPNLVEEAVLVSEDSMWEVQEVESAHAFEGLTAVEYNHDRLADHPEEPQRCRRLLLDRVAAVDPQNDIGIECSCQEIGLGIPAEPLFRSSPIRSWCEPDSAVSREDFPAIVRPISTTRMGD